MPCPAPPLPRRPASMSRDDASEGAVPHGRFVPSEWVAARRPEHIDRHGAPLVPGTGWLDETGAPDMPVPYVLAGRDGSPLYVGDRAIAVPCGSARHILGYPIHPTTIRHILGFVDDGEDFSAIARCRYEGERPPLGMDFRTPNVYHISQHWFDFELVALDHPGWLCRRISRIQLLWCSYHLPHSAVWVKLRLAFCRGGLAETTLRLIGSFLMAGPTTARVALRLAGMTHIG